MGRPKKLLDPNLPTKGEKALSKKLAKTRFMLDAYYGRFFKLKESFDKVLASLEEDIAYHESE